MQSPDPNSSELADQPGTNGIWTFVFIDMIVFSLIFVVFLSEKMRLPTVFAAGQAQLDFRLGLVNALLLITSSLFMAEAVSAVRRGLIERMRINLRACVLFAGLFCINKIFEFSKEIYAGYTPAYDSFYSFYYFITGAHFLHALGGMVFITHCLRQPCVEVSQEKFRRKLENTGVFWHFVDLLWFFIFPLLYLSGAI